MSSLCWGTDAIPRLFDWISNFPHPRDALACFFFCVLGHLRLNFKSVSLGTREHRTQTLELCRVSCVNTLLLLFFFTFKEKILTLEIGNKRIVSGGLDSDTEPSPSRLLYHTTVSLCPPSFRLFIHSALIFMGAKINFIWYYDVISLINFLNHVN